MESKKKKFYGYNDGLAMTMYSCILLFWPSVILISISIILTILSSLLTNYYLLLVWIAPVILLFAYVLILLTSNYNDKVFLQGQKTCRKSLFCQADLQNRHNLCQSKYMLL